MVGATILGKVVRNHSLRWPIPKLPIDGRTILGLTRRAKYLLMDCGNGTLILHLGMSGSLRILPSGTPAAAHDHFDLLLDNGKLMRLRDPRRFGAVLWHEGDIDTHPLLANLGPEPLQEDFDARYLHQSLRGRSIAIKQALMDNHIVVGVGNIYANEALFRARIDPRRAAGRIGLRRYGVLAKTLREVLGEAIVQGGTTLRDFVNASGKPGYFQQTLAVYGREGSPCLLCGEPVRCFRLAQRSTFHCPRCQH